MTATQIRRTAEQPDPPTGIPVRGGVPGDPLLEARLARLAARSSAHRQAAPAPGPGPGRTKRRHAAEGSRSVALALSIGTTLSLAGYLYSQQTIDNSTTAADAATATVPSTVPTTVAVVTVSAAQVVAAGASEATASAAEAAAAAASASSTTGLADGTYTGDTFTNRWGPVQVATTVTDGMITDVTALQVPDDDRKSVSINNRAVPLLVEQTLTAQSADVDTVSGATYTSDGYRQSLQTAIDQARAAAVS